MIETNSKNLERRIKRLIPGKFKMWFVRRLISPYMGRIVQVFCRKTLMGARFNLKSVDPVSAAKIYFGVWESAEIRFSKNMLARTTLLLNWAVL